MSTIEHLWRKLWANVRDILHGSGKASQVFHLLLQIFALYQPEIAAAVQELVAQAAGLENMTGEQRRAWVIEQAIVRYPAISNSRLNWLIETAVQSLPAKLKVWQ